MGNSPKWIKTPGPNFSGPQPIEKEKQLDQAKAPHRPIRRRLWFEKVNEITWKLTNGEQTNVPASHGQWGGYRTSKAIAWVICVAPGKWLARCGNQASGPERLGQAKARAMAMAKGADGDYQIDDEVRHLNALQAVLTDRDRDDAEFGMAPERERAERPVDPPKGMATHDPAAQA